MSQLYVNNIKSRVGGAVSFSQGIIGAGATFTGNVSIGGTLTYEDVTNVESVGIVTAGGGIRIGTGGTVGPVGSGIVTYYGDGSKLTGVDSTALKDVNDTVRVQANTSGAVVTGVLTATSFSGDGSGLTFTPKILAFDPQALSTEVAVDKTITITFDQNIQFSGNGTVELRSGSAGGSVIQSFAISSGSPATGLSIVGTQLIINPTSNFAANTVVYVILPSTGISATSGTVYGGSNTYNFRTAVQTFSAQGGDIVFTEVAPGSPTGYHRFHIFTSSGILTTTSDVSNANDFAMVLVAGGGAGGQSQDTPGTYSTGAGGGGAGGVIRHTGPTVILAAGDHTVTIGSGGVNNTSVTPGSNSTLVHPTNTYTVTGGGGGGNYNPPADQFLPSPSFKGGNGGSGGGAAGNFAPGFPPTPDTGFEVTPGANGISGQGNPGGGVFRPSPSTYNPSVGVPAYGGGGGGAGGAGDSASNPPVSGYPGPSNPGQQYLSMQAGDGGNGLANPEFPEPILAPHLPAPYGDLAIAMGPTGLVGGGGGGGNGGSKPPQWDPNTPTPNRPLIPGAGRGGPGGGGDGSAIKAAPFPPIMAPSIPIAQPGINGTGGGGGGGAWGNPGYPTSKYGGNGGSGILMIRYSAPAP